MKSRQMLDLSALLWAFDSRKSRTARDFASWCLAASLSLLALSCSGTDRAPGFEGEGGAGGPSGEESCDPGQTKACGITLEQGNGILACYHGRASCGEGGIWGECLDGKVTYRPDPRSADYRNRFKLKAAALLPPNSMPAECSDNPCDPQCMFYDEDPMDLTATGGTPSSTLPDFPGGSGVQACDHDLCQTGSALYAPCHSCVTTVCANTPSCCSTAWTSTCTDLVYSLCNNTRPPLSLCEIGLYSDLTISLANRASADALVASYGDMTFATEGWPAGAYSKGNISFSSLNQAISVPKGIVADGWVDAQDANYNVAGFIEAGGNVTIRSWDIIQASGTGGYVSSGGALTGQNNTTIVGNARANSGISTVSSVGGTSCSTIGCYTHKPVVLPTKTGVGAAATAIPVLATNCTGSTNYSVSGGTTTINPGVYGDVNIFNNGTLRLNGEGTYYFKSFQVWDRVVFKRTATNTGQGWDIRVCNTVSLGNGTQFRGENTSGVMPNLVLDSTNSVLMDPSLVTFYANTTGAISMGTDVFFTGIFIAPNTSGLSKANVNTPPTRAQVVAGTRSAPVNGAIWAHSLSLGTDALTKQISQSACEAKGITGTTDPTTCPITNVTPNIPPAINEPCSTGLNCQINHRCDKPVTSNTCAHSKCMPGAALSSSCDACVTRICAQDASCCSTSWTPACVDKVATICDATCDDYSCYIPNACATSSSGLDSTCHSCIASVCAVDASCCTTAWTQSCVDKVYTLCGSGIPNSPTSGTSICDYATYANGAAAIMGTNVGLNAKVYGGRIGGAGLGSMNLSFTQLNGDVYNAGSFYTFNTSVTGTIYYGSGSNAINAPTSYTALVNATPPQPARPTRTFTCGGSNITAGGSVSPGSYGSVSIPNGQTLTLSAGTYYFNSLAIGTSAGTSASYGTLALPASGRVVINVCGTVNFNQYSRVTGLTASTAGQLDVYATGNIRMYPGTITYGIYNSNSDVAVNGASGAIPGAILYGMAWSGNTINVLGTNATIDATGVASSCKTNIDGGFSSGRRLDRLCAYASYSKQTTAFSGGTNISGGDVGAGTTISVTDTTRVAGNVLAEGNITKGTTSVYSQSVRSKGTISGSAPVYGTQTSSATAAQVPKPTWPTVSFSCSGGKPPGGANQSLGSNTTLAPGTYGDVSFTTGSRTLTLQAGDYYLGDLTLTQSSLTLALPASGTVRIYACDQVNFGSGLAITNQGMDATLSKLQIYSLSTASADASPAIYLNTGSNRPVGGVFVAPSGKISVGSNTTVNGSIWGNQIFTATTGAVVSASGWAGANCQAASVDALPSCPIAVTTTTPTETGDCIANSLGYTDSTCSTYDLAADIPCGDKVPVCNHGTADYTGNVTIGYWDNGDGQMSLSTPSKVPDGTCTGTGLTIVAGNCVDVTCAIPAGTYTVMVDPSNTLSECGTGTFNRRLDNWTVDDGRTCSSGGMPLEVEYEYYADCEDDMKPLWGLLTWDTNTPGTSTVTFEAKVASSSAGLSAASYTTVGTAQASPVDTSLCSYSSPSGCPVDVFDELALTQNQDADYLALRITLNPTATDSPVLENWELTYTCTFDQ